MEVDMPLALFHIFNQVIRAGITYVEKNRTPFGADQSSS
jgi:hypothetical protein